MNKDHALKSLLLGTALAVPSLYATTAAAQDNVCVALEQRVSEVDLSATDYTEDEFLRVVEAGDVQECAVWLEELEAVIVTLEGTQTETEQAEAVVQETERARITLSDEVVIEGTVWVDQEAAEVAVEEAPVEVMVGSAQPEVTVREQQADILIRQAAPTIRLSMPQPTISIEQPAPEIIVTMPPPGVEIASARPTVEVRQGEPTVRVAQPEPQVELELYEAENPETSQGIQVSSRRAAEGAPQPEPQVTMSRAEAQVVYEEGTESQQANVQVAQAQPNVRFEQAEPQVEVMTEGEPQIQWSQAGEATVTFQEAEGGTEMAGNAQQPQQPQDEGMAAMNGPQVEREGFEMATIDEIEAQTLTGASVYGVNDEDVGEIGDLVMGEEGQQVQAAIIDVGGFLGMGERNVRVPFEDLTILRAEGGDEVRVYMDATEEQLESYPEAE